MKKTISIFAIVFFGFFFALPTSAITFNTSKLQLFKNELKITGCVSEGYLPVFWYSEPEHNLISETDCQTGRTIIDFTGYNHITGQPAYFGLQLSAEEEMTTASFVVFSSILNMPISGFDDLFASAGTLFSDLWVIIAVAIGVPLAFYIINKAISMIVFRRKEK